MIQRALSASEQGYREGPLLRIKMKTFQPSRTFGIASVGLFSLSTLELGLFLLLAWALRYSESPTFPGQLVTSIQVVAGCIAIVSVAGVAAMAARDWKSGGLTSSQSQQVLTAQLLSQRSLEDMS